MEIKNLKQAEEQNNRTLGETLILLQKMVDSFTSVNYNSWEKFRENYEKEHGFRIDRPLSMQSYIGSDLLIDFAYLAQESELRVPFVREYWIRSQGVQCIRDDEDRENNNKVWGDVVGKIHLEFDGQFFQNIGWFEDEKCQIKNRLIEEGLLYEQYY